MIETYDTSSLRSGSSQSQHLAVVVKRLKSAGNLDGADAASTSPGR